MVEIVRIRKYSAIYNSNQTGSAYIKTFVEITSMSIVWTKKGAEFALI